MRDEPTRFQERVILFDVDNTLLDNDAVQEDLRAHIAREFGDEARDRYWGILERLRAELGYVDYLGALERYRFECIREPRVLALSCWLVDYPFARRLYPAAMRVLEHARRAGSVAILSDGDAVFQPCKVMRSGLWNAVDGRVLIYVHKEDMLAEIERLLPARHYVMVDDKVRILAAMKSAWGERLTTVQPRQGHYANDPSNARRYPAADVTIPAIDDLLRIDFARLGVAASSTPGA